MLQWRLWEDIGFFPKNGINSTMSPLLWKLHGQRTNIIFGFFIQIIILNEYHASFVSIDTSKPHLEMSIDFLPNYIEIVASTNQSVLLCHTYNEPWYYMDNPTNRQGWTILNPKIWYDTIEFGMMVKRSKPLQYKIVIFSKPNFRSHDKEFYLHHYIRA